ncbi:RNA polymerase II subunit A C-terminal domain phosphatase [Erysiphe neolycopersici]|uniref:RNA polymerase II subunit A C-terminal domain phosphatase n=1 Tax=Erysiphe neolycopersici TaxID=212602 RepID=A0A420HT33_9PEZI|nr:RNA polymerase II subunit A C-terminal domain phosphatase [Erysiphe neolycopersici]
MGKLLKLGTKLKYPLTIGRLLKSPGDEIHKQEAIMQFKFTWKQKVGDPFGEEWEEDQTTIADWDSPTEGHIKLWKVHEGMVIERDMPFVEIEESCLHAVQYFGLCCFCGKDMTQVTWASSSDDTVYAKINMIHNQTSLTISEDEASKAEKELQRRLLKNRKLSLVVDLDQTIIHACIEPTIGEWQNDPTSPNYEAVKEVQSFQLNDDWPRGVASGCWYYIKMRPGLKKFLNKISEMYELHVYTMGTRAYAMNIAKIVDPEKKLFGDRIISRDENGSITTKSLSRLFPVNTKMVVIIDDRADVWPKNRSNLVKVVPYDFFLGIGDINSSFLPKREEMFKITSIPEKNEDVSEKKEIFEPVKVDSITEDNNMIESNDDEKARTQVEENDSQKNSKADTLQELLSMGGGGGEEEARRLQQTVEQEKLLEKQFKERPLLHMQEKLDKEETKDEVSKINLSSKPEDNIHQKHNLLKDDDVELKYLERNLTHLHKIFYDEYDKAVVNAGYKNNPKGTDPNYDVLDLNVVPDIGNLLPRLKAQTFAGCFIATAGLFLYNQDLLKLKSEFGAKLVNKVNRSCTHLIVSTDSPSSNEVRQALRYPHIKIVNKDWLKDSISKWEKEDEGPYLINLRRGNNFNENLHEDLAALSTQPSDDNGPSKNDDETSPLTYASLTDVKDVFPPEVKVESQTNGLGSIDWEGVDEELAEFMSEEDFENDSDTSEIIGFKRGREELTDDVDSENESSLSKKQKLTSERQSRLHEVITLDQNHMNDTIAHTTPKITTISEEIADQIENSTNKTTEGLDVDGDSELEALLMAEFEKEVAEEKNINEESRENATAVSGENSSTVSQK